jgi:cytochrome c
MGLMPRIFLIACIICILTGCEKQKISAVRPRDPWVFRSVLDTKPRMVTIALDSECYVAYDLVSCTLYKSWKGGVMLEGAAYTDKKNVQPVTWGKSYYADTLNNFKWTAQRNGQSVLQRVFSKGYLFRDDQVFFRYSMIISSGDTVNIEERPEFFREGKRLIFERLFQTSRVPEGVSVSLRSLKAAFELKSNSTTVLSSYFDPLPKQYPPDKQKEYDHRGRYYIEKSDCLTCHEFDKKTVGPSFLQIAERYKDQEGAMKNLINKVKYGGKGEWGNTEMNAHPDLTDTEIKTMMDYILALNADVNTGLPSTTPKPQSKSTKPGFGAPLEGVHPAFDLSTLHRNDFKPRVGGLAFLPDGRLAVTTWDTVGGVYLLDGVEAGDSSRVSVKRIAEGLAEPLGIEVVNGQIFVLQKQELTQLIDHDGDEVTDEYRTICSSWGVTGDFHEFAFGLIYKDGHFYATLSLAMRLLAGEKQQFDRGRTIRIGMDGTHEWINYGLRTPNGIGLGVDGEIFVTDNQGEWIPANKLIHVKKGDYHGMPWGLPDPSSPPPVAPPTIWLPEDEIGNSPSEPVLIPEGPYKGQMLHGDVTHGGIKRDFIEKVNGAYQGAVFRFTQGLEAGVNRLCWGPDGALYIGGIGMVGGWSWKEKQFGLQRMKYNGKVVFEMLAVRAKPNGFEIEFTEPLDTTREINASAFFVQQWWYQPTSDYGGPKMEPEQLPIRKISLSSDGKRAYFEIRGLKKQHVVYFRLPDDLKSTTGQSLWSSEAWYTLNNIPE